MWDALRCAVVEWVSAHNLSAQGWTVVAAAFSALSSFLIMRIHRSNLLESVRPELVLLGWSRNFRGQGQSAHDVLTFSGIKNVGRGTAFNIWLHTVHDTAGRSFMVTKRLSILAANEQGTFEAGEPSVIQLWFKNAAGNPTIHVTLHVSSWDSRGNYYDTRYGLTGC